MHAISKTWATFGRWALGSLIAFAALAHAEDGNPLQGASPIRIIVAYSAGGPADRISRTLAQGLTERLHRPVIVENHTGAGGELANTLVARANPDGATILFNSSAIAIDPVVKSKTPYNVARDFRPVATVASAPLVVLVNPKLQARTVAELVNYARANPDKLNFGSAGEGTSVYMVSQQFMQAAAIRMVHVPYRGSSQDVMATISDEIQFLLNPMPVALQYARATGQLRALAVTTAKRSSIWPELPTIAESGLPGLKDFDASIWWQMLVPSRTPDAVVDKLNTEILAVLHTSQMAQQLREQGMEATSDSAAQARERLNSEINRWTQLVKTTGIKVGS